MKSNLIFPKKMALAEAVISKNLMGLYGFIVQYTVTII